MTIYYLQHYGIGASVIIKPFDNALLKIIIDIAKWARITPILSEINNE